MADSNHKRIASLDCVSNLIADYRGYARARMKFLEVIGAQQSCRDPHAELSEVLVATILDAKIPTSRVQKGYDLVKPNSRHVQVKYLCNRGGIWINEHHVRFTESVDDYALVVIMDFQLQGVLIFAKENMSQVCKRLKKRHPNQDTTLQLTRKNYMTITANVSEFLQMGVEIYQMQR